MIRIAHISDLHFSRFSLDPTQLFSKRWLGNLNLLFNRSKDYLNARPFSLIPTFKKKGITHVIISGDLTTTSSHAEYQIAKRFVKELEEMGIKVFSIPGNHDHYTKKADRTKRFYHYFPQKGGGDFQLSQHGVSSCPLFFGWHLVLLDTTCATPLTSSNGYFSPIIEENLKKLIETIPQNEQILLVNHFPFFDHDLPRRRLIRGEKLHALISHYPNVQIYLHGHTHRHTIADLRPNDLPLILNSGSTGHKKGSWNQLDLEGKSLKLTVNRWDEEWKEIKKHSFSFTSKPWYHKGLRFKCTGCGKCCTGKGFVWLTEEDIERLALSLNLSEEDFRKKYTREEGFDISLTEDPVTDDCIFLREKKFCAVYDARPKQCRNFPWWKGNLETPKDWENAKKRCEGIDHEEAPLFTLSEIEKELD
ncbi:MAG: YkgJ family cysteine cluster protein [Chlamydiia bacterium]|nr:YkgJ family cysteine cluster protein [Chlamydiia bacterium]